ncbi:hypothetical protein ACS0TY_004242 [Phlomoides rotata]
MGEEKPRGIGGYNCYSDASSSGNNHLVSHFQSLPEIYNMTVAGDMNLGETLWKGFGNHHQDGAADDPSTSMQINEPTSSEFYHHQHDFNKKHDLSLISGTTNDQTLMISSPWNHHQNQSYHDQSRLISEDDGRMFTRQGLSLSLNSSSIGFQSNFQDDLRFGPSSSRSVNHAEIMEEHNHIRNSRYLIPAQELLNEFCNIGTKKKAAAQEKKGEWKDENALKKQSLDLLDLQRRKTKLLQMVEEVDRRYKHYCDQMRGVTSSFESVAGKGAATVYSALASQAMSRHFRCLRDGIVGEIKATKKAMGEKDVSAPGTVKGETPRLRVLDQTLRQQKALQQMSLMETHPWRPQRGLPERSVSVLRAWLFEHFLHPYPSDVDKHILARQTGLSRSQVSNWFINARVRLWKPMVEEMYMEELKENDDQNQNQNQNLQRNEDQKPTHDQLLRIDSECLSSIINNPDKDSTKNHENPNFGSYGAMELDFGGGALPNYGGVSLTLGLHQHGGGGGVSLAFTTGGAQSSLFETVNDQYSLLDNEENQTLPYRNLMGAQLLRDLAG